MLRVCLLVWVAVCAGAAKANYTFPLGGPYLQHPQPFQSYQPQQPQQLTHTRRAPYTPPTYLPPPPPTPYGETQQSFTESSYYNYQENRHDTRTNINNEYYQSNAAPKEEIYEYQNPTSDDSKKVQEFPGRPGGFTRVHGGQGKAQLHAVLDYDDDYYDDESGVAPASGSNQGQAATPIQGPIFVQNGSVPVVPLYSYPVLNNGSFVQIPILWSALSVALGLEVRGQLIRGVPCVKRFHQLFCPTAGNTYPIERIEHFIDENKALMKRMYGDFTVFTDYGAPRRGKRGAPEVLDPFSGDAKVHAHWADIYSEPDTTRKTRQTQTTRARPSSGSSSPPFLNTNQGNSSGRIDACESKMEILTPYWALNSAGKVRAVVNTMHFEQAIHQEVCSKTQTNRCAGDCGCEQKYKWHRLLAYDPDQDCAGIFMDWFLFPSCCVCRCTP